MLFVSAGGGRSEGFELFHGYFLPDGFGPFCLTQGPFHEFVEIKGF